MIFELLTINKNRKAQEYQGFSGFLLDEAMTENRKCSHCFFPGCLEGLFELI